MEATPTEEQIQLLIDALSANPFWAKILYEDAESPEEEVGVAIALWESGIRVIETKGRPKVIIKDPY